MIDYSSVNHHIKKHIIDALTYQKVARFRDLRPPRVDTNLFTYHLKSLMKSGFVEKAKEGYTLGSAGISYIDRVNGGDVGGQAHPKVIIMFVIQNSEGDILLQRLTEQPYIDTWTLPYGKRQDKDSSVKVAAQREMYEKYGYKTQSLDHAGDCYINVYADKELLSTTVAHVFRLYADDIVVSDTCMWARPHKLTQVPLAPAVEAIMTRTFFKDTFFFEEYDVNLK